MGRPDKYILIGQSPVPEPDLERWGRWMEEGDRRVAEDTLDGLWVSTVFVGLDYFFGDGPPLLFETAVFPAAPAQDRWQELYQARSSTWLEAEAEHRKAVAMVRSGALKAGRPSDQTA